MLRSRALLGLFSIAWLVTGCGDHPPAADAGHGDAAEDAALACRADVDCDDGLACNGTETCDASGRCVAGRPMVCDDGVACTIDSCSELARACVARVPDRDGDGVGAASCVDGTGTPLGTDCDDDDPLRFPGNRERCDAEMHDEDCDPTTHGGVDADGDGVEDIRCCNGTDCGTDCDDAHASAHPGATEACNYVDDDCDGRLDEGVSVSGFADRDHDGYGDPAMPTTACTTAAGFSPYGTDCDDARPERHPAQPELCDGVDNDCDTRVDESASAVTWYADLDGDGFGSAASGTMTSCAPLAGYDLRDTDCNDHAPSISPAALEICDAIDDDCNGVADYRIPGGDLEDDDGDGVADLGCGAPIGRDCDDHDATSAPGTVEVCDGRDNDCDGTVDEGATEVVFYRDADRDGFGTSTDIARACTPPAGYVPRGGDCDDTQAARAPGIVEICDGVDQDCDRAIDEGEATTSCAVAHSAMACIAGACTVVACEPSYGDCSPAAGCETSLLSDPNHCGSCGACASPFASCTDGRCGPDLASLAAIDTDVGDVVVERVLAVPGSTDYVIAGRFTGTLRLGSFTLTSLGDYDGFAARMRVDGSALWANRWGDVGFDAVHAVAALPDGSALVVGGEICNTNLCGGVVPGCIGFYQRFASIAAPGCNYADWIAAGSASIRGLAMERVGSITYVYGTGSYTGTGTRGVLATASGSLDGFVFRARETASQPVYEWTHLFTGVYDEVPLDLALEGPSGVAIVGYTSSGADFGFGPTGHAGYDDAFLVDLDRTNGNIRQGGQFGTNLGYDHAERIVILPSGDAAISGYFGPTPFAFPGGAVINGTSGQNAFVLTATPASFTGHWATAFGPNSEVTGLSVVGTDVIATGWMTGSIRLDRGTLSATGRAAFLASLTQGSGATSFAVATAGGANERTGGAIGLPDGRILWEIEHSAALTVGDATLAAGVDADAARAVMTP